VIRPTTPPNAEQIALVSAAATLFAVSAATSASEYFHKRPFPGKMALLAGWFGVVLGVVGLLWHAVGPLDDNFSALAWLGVMLGACSVYVQMRRPLPGLDWFVLPVAILMLIAAVVFGWAEPRAYSQTLWPIVHLVTAFGGIGALSIAAVVGAMYLINNHRLRTKRLAGGPPLGSLERLESVAQTALTIGLPLFTVGIVTGVILALYGTAEGLPPRQEFFGPKILLAIGVWVVYALALHTPINPSFRGKKAAVLSLIGFVLMVGTLVSIQFMPTGGK